MENEISIHEFMRRFLPRYNSRFADFKEYFVEHNFNDRLIFIENTFPEAIANFKEKICKSQIEMIANNFNHDNMRCLYKDIMNYEQPTLNDLL
ncbi:MAG: hypothetical protein LBE36_13445 [Flavobacteriaceae bacterium]|jgi:hypothetical protein|nr:hypothetical protein [Flavobacteriaceae bacterium]